MALGYLISIIGFMTFGLIVDEPLWCVVSVLISIEQEIYQIRKGR